MHALIIEDEAVIAMSIEDTLLSCGFETVDLVATPQAAFDAVARQRPALITSDVQLEPGNGIDTVLEICSSAAIPVIFLTGSLAEVTRRMPASVALQKPFTHENLKEAVALVMAQPDAVAVLLLNE